MQGRRPIPTRLKLIKGEQHKSRINKREPTPPGQLTAAPEWLTPAQREGWEYATANAPPGMLRRLDRATLTLFVIAETLHREACEKVAGLGLIVKTKTGEAMQNPFLPIINKQALIMIRAAAELGFTPSARSRIQMGEGNEPDPNEHYFD